LTTAEFFSTDFRKNIQIPSFIKISPVGAEAFHADERTDRHHDAESRFSHFFMKVPDISSARRKNILTVVRLKQRVLFGVSNTRSSETTWRPREILRRENRDLFICAY